MATQGLRKAVPDPDEVQDRQRGQDALGHRHRDLPDRDETAGFTGGPRNGSPTGDATAETSLRPCRPRAWSPYVRGPNTIPRAPPSCVSRAPSHKPVGTQAHRVEPWPGKDRPNHLFCGRAAVGTVRDLCDPPKNPAHGFWIGGWSNGRRLHKSQFDSPDPVRKPTPPSPREPAPWRGMPTLQWN